MGIKEVKITGRENYFVREYQKCGQGYVNAVQKYNLYKKWDGVRVYIPRTLVITTESDNGEPLLYALRQCFENLKIEFNVLN